MYAIMLEASRRPDPLQKEMVFAGSDYLTASTSRRYFEGEVAKAMKNLSR